MPTPDFEIFTFIGERCAGGGPSLLFDGVPAAGTGRPPPAPPTGRHDDLSSPLASGGGLPGPFGFGGFTPFRPPRSLTIFL